MPLSCISGLLRCWYYTHTGLIFCETAKCKTYTTLFIWVLLVLRVPGKASSVLLSTLSPEGAIRLCLIKYQMMIPNNVCLRLEQNFNHILL